MAKYLQSSENIPINETGDNISFDLSNEIKQLLEKIPNLEKKILWTNPNPTSEFASQTITLNSDDYDILEIFYSYNPLGVGAIDGYQSIRILKGVIGGALQRTVIGNGDYFQIQSRTITRVDDTHYTFGNGRTYISSTNTYATNDSRVIPYKIIGYK